MYMGMFLICMNQNEIQSKLRKNKVEVKFVPHLQVIDCFGLIYNSGILSLVSDILKKCHNK